MGNYIKYTRFTEEFDDNSKIQDFLDGLSSDGWDIISYSERPKDVKILSIIILAGRKNLGAKELL